MNEVNQWPPDIRSIRSNKIPSSKNRSNNKSTSRRMRRSRGGAEDGPDQKEEQRMGLSRRRSRGWAGGDDLRSRKPGTTSVTCHLGVREVCHSSHRGAGGAEDGPEQKEEQRRSRR